MRNYTIGRIWKIPIRINISLLVFLPILAYLLGSSQQIDLYLTLINSLWPGTLAPDAFTDVGRSWTIGIAGAVGLFVSVAIHELGHAYAARRYGIATESITLWILGGLASLATFPKEWDREFWIAIAGPATSVALAAVCWVSLQAIPSSAPVLVFVVGWLAITNIVLTVFNLLPAFPMDGGRVLRALLARNRPYAQATRIAARIGVIFAILFAVVGALAFSPILLLLALFIYTAATSESRTVVMDELLTDLTVADLARLDETDAVPGDTTIADLMDRLLAERRTDFAVREDGAIVGVVTAGSLRSVAAEEYGTTAASSVMRTDLPTVAASMDAFDALVALNTARSDIALVEVDGRAVGTISQADFTAAMNLRRGTTVAM